jgi:hypothetical protein
VRTCKIKKRKKERKKDQQKMKSNNETEKQKETSQTFQPHTLFPCRFFSDAVLECKPSSVAAPRISLELNADELAPSPVDKLTWRVEFELVVVVDEEEAWL